MPHTKHDNDSIVSRYYFVDGFRGYEKDSAEFDRFVSHIIDSNYAKYYNYSIIFVEKTKIANENYRAPIGEGPYVYEPPILHYEWLYGRFTGCTDYSKPGGNYFKRNGGIFNAK